jgi:hypothetical protein
MPKNKNFTISEMYCTECGNKGIDIPRRAGQQREAGHLKRIYCLKCGETNHVEVRPFGKYRYEDFLLEFKGKNFDSEGNRIYPYKIFKRQLGNEGKLIQLQNDIKLEIMQKEKNNE